MDHLIQIPIASAEDEPFMEAWTAITALAAVTSRIRLATLVSSVAYRNPALLAMLAAGVDQISRGRLTFGFGAGWHEPEYRQYGYEFPPKPATRIRQIEEGLRLILTMWDGKAEHLPRPLVPRRGRDPGAEAGAEAAPADHDRWQRRATYAARRGAAR
jgi:alkanesulfonate monooxygenase SsuD/methylene tetrahydromethanopterin reductase-like flavin-dependent oxidoreductase (luciferase family)